MRKYINTFIQKIDKAPLWFFIIPLTALWFAPYIFMGEKTVFTIHDQLDETFLAYLFNARHLFDKSDIFPEMLGGINRSGLQPAAPLFVFLYVFFNPFTAFVLQYLFVFLTAFLGMYFCIRELTSSNILALTISGCFAILPYAPIYGTSVVCVPLALYALLLLYQRKCLPIAYILLIYISLTSHLVLIGFVLLGIWGVLLVVAFIKKFKNIHIYLGFSTLLIGYILMNISLFVELLFKQSPYTSHREELLNSSTPFVESVKSMFLKGMDLHAPSLHTGLILPILIGLVVVCIFRKKITVQKKPVFYIALINMLLIICVTLLYGFFSTEFVANLKNQLTGILHYYTFERVIWVYPTVWYLEAALVLILLWDLLKEKCLLHILLLTVFMAPTARNNIYESYLYFNVNQYNNGSHITGMPTWDEYFSAELMENIDKTIGEDKSSYRIAHLGISPAPSLAYGFYTVDGYSNNYPLEYKHQFRQVIAGELAKNEYCQNYFDNWGSRAYLFNNITSNAMMCKKGIALEYENLDFDMTALYDLGCRYIFSCAPITDAERMSLDYIDYFETTDSYWGIHLYKLTVE